MIVPVYTPTFDLSSLEGALLGGLGHKVAGFNAWSCRTNTSSSRAAVGGGVPGPPRPGPDSHTHPGSSGPCSHQQARRRGSAVTQERLTAQEYFERAWTKKGEGDYDRAIADYDEAIRLDPSSVGSSTGASPVRPRGVDRAIADYDEAIRLDPTTPCRSTTGVSPAEPRGRRPGHRRLHRGHPPRPERRRAFNNRGLARRPRGSTTGPSPTTPRPSASTRTGPGVPQPGLARGTKGEYDRAIADFRRGKTLAPDDPDFDERLGEPEGPE